MRLPATFRNTRGVMTSFNINFVNVRNPNVLTWWSAAFPGFGHLLLCKYVTGLMLIVWEFIVNLNANLNLSILYTFIGDFGHAEAVLNKKWLLLYIPPYIFAMWDTRRLVYDLNKSAVIAELSHATLPRIRISPLEVNLLTKRHPSLAVLWSSLMPGLGHLYVNRLPDGFFLIIVWMSCCYFSNALEAIHLTFMGRFGDVAQAVNPRWLLFMPSIYAFTIYDAYMNCVEINRAFHFEQAAFLRRNYQDKSFLSYTSLFTCGVDLMNIIASFEQTTSIELAIHELQRQGVPKDSILAIPLIDKEKPQKLQHIMNNDGFYLLNVPLCVGSAMMTLGTIYGFIWTGGPILWGLIGFAVGNIVGFLCELAFQWRKIQLIRRRNKGPDVFLVIHCPKQIMPLVKEILFEYNALAISEVDFEQTRESG